MATKSVLNPFTSRTGAVCTYTSAGALRTHKLCRVSFTVMSCLAYVQLSPLEELKDAYLLFSLRLKLIRPWSDGLINLL